MWSRGLPAVATRSASHSFVDWLLRAQVTPFDHTPNVILPADLAVDEPEQFPLGKVQLPRDFTEEPVVHLSLAVADASADSPPSPTHDQPEHCVVLGLDAFKALVDEYVAQPLGVDLGHATEETCATRSESFFFSSRASPPN